MEVHSDLCVMDLTLFRWSYHLINLGHGFNSCSQFAHIFLDVDSLIRLCYVSLKTLFYV